jgi:hypothetical protein
MNDEASSKTTVSKGSGELRDRRLFLQSLGKWSGAAIAAAVFGSAWLGIPPEVNAGVAWINRRGYGGGGGWINRGWSGGGGWINGYGGGGGWINGYGGGGGGWINRRGYGGGGAWVNRW